MYSKTCGTMYSKTFSKTINGTIQLARLLCNGLTLSFIVDSKFHARPKQQITLSMLIKIESNSIEKLPNRNQNLQVPQVSQQPETFEAHPGEKSPSYLCSVDSSQVVSMNN